MSQTTNNQQKLNHYGQNMFPEKGDCKHFPVGYCRSYFNSVVGTKH